jgi:hypothetical protein
MDRIIKGYKMGGKVKYYNEGTPKTTTGLPVGGNAASAIASYLTAPLTGTLSYDPTAAQQGDAYLKAAKERRELRDSLKETDLTPTQQAIVMNNSNEDKMEERKEKGGDLYQYNYLTDPATVAANAEMDRLGIDPDRNESTFSGGGADGQGNFGTFGDYLGGIGDALGVTDYAGKAAKKAAEEKAYNQKVMSNFADNYGNKKEDTPSYDYSYGSDYAYYNQGGPIGYNAGDKVSPSGVSLAQTRLDEEEERIRQRNMMTAQIRQQQQGPLGMIGSHVAGKAINKGLEDAALKVGVNAIPVVGPFLAAFL